jgi:class 3 adenylate cyclase/tetratricopeptide (TPR) repeat protein
VTCPGCGRDNPDGFRHCGHCGVALATPAPDRRKLATLVFCDVAGSTALGERLDAEAVQAMMVSYFTEAREAIESHGGTVEKFIGDAVVAAFGIPRLHEDDALRACRAALEIKQRLSSRIALRIGVNTGEIVARDPSVRDPFVTGDPVNVASRLEQAAAPGEVLIGEQTYRLVSGAVTVEAVEALRAKGKSEPVRAYRLLAVVGAGPAPTTAGNELVGRDRELAVLKREFAMAVAERRCRVATIVGEAGVGKSRLAAELVDRLAAQPRVVRGVCLSYGEGITFWAIDQIVRQLVGIADEDAPVEARAKLEALLAGAPGARAVAEQIALLLGIGAGSTSTEELGWGLRHFLTAVALERPLLVLVEDLQWAQPALLELLADLATRPLDAPVLLCFLARRELLERDPHWPVTVELQPLGEAEVEKLLETLNAPRDARARIARAAAGNPLFVEELVAWVGGGGELDVLPTTLSALLGARLDQMEPAARDVLERGAVEGEVFHRSAVVELSEELARRAVPGQLDQLVERGLVRATAPRFAGEVAFSFKHILVREVAYRATTKQLRAALHERFADWLERLLGELVSQYEEILGYHLEQSYRYGLELGSADPALAERAGRSRAAAGLRAAARGDMPATAELLGRAAGLLSETDPRRLELLPTLASALRETGAYDAAHRTLDELERLAVATGDRRLSAHAAVDRGLLRLYTVRGEGATELESVAEHATAAFSKLGDEHGLGKAFYLAGCTRIIGCRFAEAEARFKRALPHARNAGDRTLTRAISIQLSTAAVLGPATVAEGRRHLGELVAGETDDRLLAARPRVALAYLCALEGEFAEARALGAEGRAVLEELGARPAAAAASFWTGQIELLAGDAIAAEADFRAGLDALEQLGEIAVAPTLMSLLAAVLVEQGRYEEAKRYAGLAEETVTHGDILTEVPVRIVRSRLAGERGEHEVAVRLAREAVELTANTDALTLRGDALLAVARASGSADAGARAYAAFEAKGSIVGMASARATLTSLNAAPS